jgi:hypothetical protein
MLQISFTVKILNSKHFVSAHTYLSRKEIILEGLLIFMYFAYIVL